MRLIFISLYEIQILVLLILMIIIFLLIIQLSFIIFLFSFFSFFLFFILLRRYFISCTILHLVDFLCISSSYLLYLSHHLIAKLSCLPIYMRVLFNYSFIHILLLIKGCKLIPIIFYVVMIFNSFLIKDLSIYLLFDDSFFIFIVLRIFRLLSLSIGT